jgi:hypothetical protein
MLNLSNLIKKIAKVTPPNNNCNKNFTSILQPKTEALKYNVMSPTERNYCLEIIKKYAPEYYSTLSLS